MTGPQSEQYGERAEELLGELVSEKSSPAVRAATAPAYATLALVEATDRQTAAVLEIVDRIAILGGDLERVLRTVR